MFEDVEKKIFGFRPEYIIHDLSKVEVGGRKSGVTFFVEILVTNEDELNFNGNEKNDVEDIKD